MSTTLYLVQRQGVYSQGECGIFDSLELARTCVTNFQALEKDTYHSFNILEFKLNEQVSITGNSATWGYSPDYDVKLVE